MPICLKSFAGEELSRFSESPGAAVLVGVPMGVAAALLLALLVKSSPGPAAAPRRYSAAQRATALQTALTLATAPVLGAPVSVS